MKRVLPILLLLCAPLSAHAEERTVKLEQVTVSNQYLFERQAYIQSKNPVVNVEVDWDQAKDWNGYAWVQLGDATGRELDLGEEYSHEFGRIKVHGEAAAFFFTNGWKPVYTEALDVSVPLGGVFLDGGTQHYSGLFTSTVSSVALRVPLSFRNGFSPEASVGKAWNRPEHLDPWYAKVSVPLGTSEKAPTVGVRGFWGAGSGVVFDLAFRY